MQQHTSKKELLNAYLGTLPSDQQDTFMSNFITLNEENKGYLLQTIRSMTPGHREVHQEGGLHFTGGGYSNVPKSTEEDLDRYLATLDKEPKSIQIDKFRKYLQI